MNVYRVDYETPLGHGRAVVEATTREKAVYAAFDLIAEQERHIPTNIGPVYIHVTHDTDTVHDGECWQTIAAHKTATYLA